MKKAFVVLFIFSSFISFSSCNNENSTNQQTDPPAIMYKNLPCNDGGLEKTSSGQEIDFTWTLKDNKLNIDFSYEAICGSVFSNNITYLRYFNNENTLYVNLQDISSVHNHCYCTFGTQVALTIKDENQLRIKFYLAQYNSSSYQLLDTLLVIRQ